MKNNLLFWFFAIFSFVNIGNLYGENSQEDVSAQAIRQISTAKDLNDFALEINQGNCSLSAQLMNDIDISEMEFPMIGTEKFKFSGTFNGNFHTITYRLTATSIYTSLFSYVENSVIKNLCVRGTIQTSYRQAGGLCGYAKDTDIQGCISSVDIQSSFKGDAAHGGILSCADGVCTIKDCLVNGSIKGKSSTCCGGIAGWCFDLTKIDNCLILMDFDLNMYDTDSYMIARNPRFVAGSNNYVIPSKVVGKTNCSMVVNDEMLSNGNVCYLLNRQQSSDRWTLHTGESVYPVPFPYGKRVESSADFVIPETGPESDDTITSPDWVKDMVVYEIATKSFNSPGKPESGTFNSVKKKMPYLEKLGINTIWLTGNCWADDHHFYNIWTQYATIRPDSIDSSLGTRDEFRAMIKSAHKHGIRVLLDVITHGVMSNSPLIKEHPTWFKNGTWEMTDYDWYGNKKELDEWWVKIWTDYIIEDGVDGYRLDVAMYRPDLWKKIRRNALAAGREIVIMQEGKNLYVEGAADTYQHYNMLTVPGGRVIKGIDSTPFVWNIGQYYQTDFAKETSRCTPQIRGSFLASIEVSSHDNGWDKFPSGQNPYVTNGSRAFMGYSALLAPAIPVMFSGEEWNADYVPVPYLAGSLFGDSRKNDGYWLYGSWLQWDQLKIKEKKEMLEDTRKMLSLRKKYSDLIYATRTATHAPIRPLDFTSSTNEKIPTPYLYYNNDRALLVAANPYDYDVEIQIEIPIQEIWNVSADKIMLKDVWGNKSHIEDISSNGNIKIKIRKDHIYRGGLAVWEISRK